MISSCLFTCGMGGAGMGGCRGGRARARSRANATVSEKRGEAGDQNHRGALNPVDGSGRAGWNDRRGGVEVRAVLRVEPLLHVPDRGVRGGAVVGGTAAWVARTSAAAAPRHGRRRHGRRRQGGMSGGMLARVWAGTAWVVRCGGAGKGGVPGRASGSEREGERDRFR